MSRNLFTAVFDALMCHDPDDKVRFVERVQAEWEAGDLDVKRQVDIVEVPVPGRPDLPELVAPRALRQRGLGSKAGRAAFVHALTHIEFNAINLALDAVYRYQDLPRQYYRDWLRVAAEESRHFMMLRLRLRELGSDYGAMPAHNGLWDMAVRSQDTVYLRMALVPRVFEARGLDVTPKMIERLQSVGDEKTVALLEIILNDEIGHVEIGNRWYIWACHAQGLEPVKTFKELLDQYFPGQLRGPFNYDARLKAGFSRAELEQLERV